MRIRKNAKLSPSWFSHASATEALQTHVCQLNQSPWDAIPFAQDSSQLEGEDSFTGNASLADSMGAVESVASMMNTVAVKAEEMVVDDNDMVQKRSKAFDHIEEQEREIEFGFEKRHRITSCCHESNGNEPKEGQSLSEHQLTLLRSYNGSSSLSSSPPMRRAPVAAAAAAAAAGARRARARAAKKSSSSSNPYEFYYYSGFGPLWGRKRGDRGGAAAAAAAAAADACKSNEAKAGDNVTTSTSMNTTQSTPSSSSQIDTNEDFDYVDDDDEDDANGDSGKKRMRKPVKARSLKSLM